MQNKVSGKPDAGEWTREFISELGPVSEQQAAVCIDQLKWHLENFQRETLLWAAQQWYRGLERMAESCGRK